MTVASTFVTAKVLVTGTAGSQPPPPAWLATTLTSPAPVKVKVTPSSPSTAGPENTANETSKPLEAVADSTTTLVVNLSAMAGKSMV